MKSPVDPRTLLCLAAAALALFTPSSSAQPPARPPAETPGAAQTPPSSRTTTPRRDAPELRRLLRQLREEYPSEFGELEQLRLRRDPEFRAQLRRILVADRVMNWLNATDPAGATELRQLRRSDPERYFQRIAELQHRAGSQRPLPPPPETILPPPGGRLDEIRHAYRESADPEERKKLREDARKILLQHFAARRRAAEERLRWIRSETERLEKSLESRGRNRDRVIRDQMSNLFPETD